MANHPCIRQGGGLGLYIAPQPSKPTCQKMQPYIDTHGKLQCKRRLPSAPPLPLVPTRVLEMHRRHCQGQLEPPPARYEAMKLMRRYHLIPAPMRRVHAGKSSRERLEMRREYLRERKRKNEPKCT